MNDRRPNHRGTNRMPFIGIPNTNNLMTEGSETTTKKVIPLKRTIRSVNYVVGLISFEEQRNRKEQSTDEVEIQEAPAKDITPPYILCMNFSQVKTQDKAPEVLDLSQDSKTDETFQLGTFIDRENSLFKAIMEKFWDYQTKREPCCDHANKFWEWAFTLWPESKFKWNFKNLDKKWFDYMVSFPQFREVLRKWIIETEDETIKELEKKTQFQNKVQKIIHEMKTIMNDLNDKLYLDQQTGKVTHEEQNHFELRTLINNGGILVTYDPAVVTSTCEKHMNEKLANNFEKDSNFLKSFNKNLRKKRDKPMAGLPLFKYTIFESKILPTASVNTSNSEKIIEDKIEKYKEIEKASNHKTLVNNDDDEDDNLITIHMNMEIEPNEEQEDSQKMEIEK